MQRISASKSVDPIYLDLPKNPLDFESSMTQDDLEVDTESISGDDELAIMRWADDGGAVSEK